jgi:hypothetical protein
MKYFVAYRQDGDEIKITEFNNRDRWLREIKILKGMDNDEDQCELLAFWAEPEEE